MLPTLAALQYTKQFLLLNIQKIFSFHALVTLSKNDFWQLFCPQFTVRPPDSALPEQPEAVVSVYGIRTPQERSEVAVGKPVDFS